MITQSFKLTLECNFIDKYIIFYCNFVNLLNLEHKKISIILSVIKNINFLSKHVARRFRFLKLFNGILAKSNCRQ